MTTHTICATCGTQYAGGPPPNGCAICNDERQYVGWDGQRWTDHDTLRRQHSLRIEEDDGLLAFGMTPGFAIDQRALLVPSVGGSILWECLPLVTDDAVAAIQARGGVRAIAISHPHFYGAMVDWSEALGGVPILTHEADRHWVQRPSPAIEHWSGDRLALAPDVTLIRCGGHFEGSTALLSHRGKGALLSGDALQVGLDRRHVSFMYSYPNLIPMRRADVVAMRDRLASDDFDAVYGYSWGRNIVGDGRRAVDVSFARYLERMAAPDGAAASAAAAKLHREVAGIHSA